MAPPTKTRPGCFRFLNLPKEIQMHIIDYATPPRCHFFFPQGPNRKSITKWGFINVILSCKTIYNIVMMQLGGSALDAPDHKPLDSMTPTDRRFIPSEDTICVLESDIPQELLKLYYEGRDIHVYDRGRFSGVMPIAPGNQLLLPFKRIINCGEDPWAFSFGNETPDFNTDLPLDNLPHLAEAMLILKSTQRDWKIPGIKQKAEPQDWTHDASETCWRLPERLKCPEQPSEASRRNPPYIKRKWDVVNPHSYFSHEIRNYERYGPDTPLDEPLENAIQPFIGKHGYCDTYLSHGGQWAGFRLFTETGRLQFAALDWCDVEEAFKVHEAAIDDGRVLRGGKTPTFVVRLWVNPSEEIGSSYDWIDVRAPLDTPEDDKMQRIVDVWNRFKRMMLRTDTK